MQGCRGSAVEQNNELLSINFFLRLLYLLKNIDHLNSQRSFQIG